MLLNEGLQDDDIPHRDKVREAIVGKWHEWFEELKQELDVRPESVFATHELILNRTHQAGSASQPMSGPLRIYPRFSPSLPTGFRKAAMAILFLSRRHLSAFIG